MPPSPYLLCSFEGGCEEHMEKLHLGGFYRWGRQRTREGKQPVTPELKSTQSLHAHEGWVTQGTLGGPEEALTLPLPTCVNCLFSFILPPPNTPCSSLGHPSFPSYEPPLTQPNL